MEKLKKHELIKNAYDGYPKGTEFTSPLSGFTYTSTGVFRVSNSGGNVYCEYISTSGLEKSACVYSASANEWAEVVTEKKPSVLDKILSFPDSEKEVGIELPQFMIKSQDGVDLYEGDKYASAWLKDGKWEIAAICTPLYRGNAVLTHPIECKAFSTKEAAESWIKEQNKPEEVVIDTVNYTVTVSSNEVLYVPKHDCKKQLFFGKEIEKIYDAYKSLQS